MTDPTRRGFFAVTAGALAGVPLLGGLFAALRVALAPAHAERPVRLLLCHESEVPADDVLVRAVTYQMRRGPAVENVAKVVFVTRDPALEDSVIAMSGECTHLSCPVQKAAPATVEGDPAGVLRCPCHGGVYSRTGKVLDGPPPRPLRRLDLELPGDGTIWLREV